MMYFIAGIIVGVLLSIAALIAGKKNSTLINHDYPQLRHLKLSNKKAEIISRRDPVKDIIND